MVGKLDEAPLKDNELLREYSDWSELAIVVFTNDPSSAWNIDSIRDEINIKANVHWNLTASLVFRATGGIFLAHSREALEAQRAVEQNLPQCLPSVLKSLIMQYYTLGASEEVPLVPHPAPKAADPAPQKQPSQSSVSLKKIWCSVRSLFIK